MMNNAKLVWIGMLACATALPAAGADARELRVADSFPVGHYLVRLLLKPWMEDVTKRTNGAVTFNYFPNQQLGKAADLLRMTQAGVIDIGYIAPSCASDKMPVSEVAQLPGMFETACEGTLAYWKVARTGLVEKYDYAPNGVAVRRRRRSVQDGFGVGRTHSGRARHGHRACRRRLRRHLRHQHGVGRDPFVDQPAGHDPAGLRA
jgi:Bacterial extracellular solute-binding protein, family 7